MRSSSGTLEALATAIATGLSITPSASEALATHAAGSLSSAPMRHGSVLGLGRGQRQRIQHGGQADQELIGPTALLAAHAQRPSQTVLTDTQRQIRPETRWAMRRPAPLRHARLAQAPRVSTALALEDLERVRQDDGRHWV
jgi:hypothetical protein